MTVYFIGGETVIWLSKLTFTTKFRVPLFYYNFIVHKNYNNKKYTN